MRLDVNDSGFHSLLFVSGAHDRTKTRLWVNHAMVGYTDDGKPALLGGFPIQGAKIYKTQKGGLVLKQSAWKDCVFLVRVSSGYRGWAWIDAVEGGEILAKGEEYASGQGSLGCTVWALVNSEGPIVVKYHVTGRRVDEAPQALRYEPTGEVLELVADSEVCDLLS